MGTAVQPNLKFEREAAKMLQNAGYEIERRTGKEHLIFRHPDGRPRIKIPGSPKNASASLVYVQRAIRNRTAMHVPPGQEADMAPARQPLNRPMGEQLADLASSYLRSKAKDKRERRERGDTSKRTPDKRYSEETAAWLRRCIEKHGALNNEDVNAAAKILELVPFQLSDARTAIGAAAYRTKGMASREYWTDFTKRIPEDATVSGGRPPIKRAPAPVRHTTIAEEAAAKAAATLPTDPDEERGRPLVGGDLTPAQRESAQRMMRESTERADAERAALLAQRGGDMKVVEGDETNGHVNGNGNGNGAITVPAGMQAALELLLQQAIEETHALSDQDIMALEGMRETMRRHAQEATANAGVITRLLERVKPKATV